MFGNIPKTHSSLAHQSSTLNNQVAPKEHLIDKNQTGQKTGDNSNEQQLYEKIILNKNDDNKNNKKETKHTRAQDLEKDKDPTPAKKDFLKLLNII